VPRNFLKCRLVNKITSGPCEVDDEDLQSINSYKILKGNKMAELQQIANWADIGDDVSNISVDTIVVGGGIAGITAAIEIAETGKRVVLIEKEASIGGRVSAMNQYFPKLCPPTCGLEINLKRIRVNPYLRILTLTEVENVSGTPGNYQIRLKANPRFVNSRCTACGKCAEVCEIERDNEFNFGMDKTKAIYLPHLMAYPLRYVVDPRYAKDERLKKCVEACEYNAIDLSMQPASIDVKAGAIVWATGWRPYDAAKLDNLGFGIYGNVITNLMMERIASENGPFQGKIMRPSDKTEPKRIGFVQCAGSRDENHLPYCSAVCCLASMKQASYVRSQYPDSEVHLFYIDVRSLGKMEDFYTKTQSDEKIHFHRGKVAKITEVPENKNLILEAENTLTGEITKTEVDMAILAVGMVPNTFYDKPPLKSELDQFGFIVPQTDGGVIGTGTALRPLDVSGTVRDATGAALKAINMSQGR
jgi:quinone-modifying oxidoreductase subunit QmoA